MSRIREAVLRGVPTRQAVLDGITRSASVVTSAAVIMISIFVSFVFIDRIELKQVGLGLTVAVLVDAVVLRILILPAAMLLLGKRCWWPATSGHRRPPRLTGEPEDQRDEGHQHQGEPMINSASRPLPPRG